MIILIADPIGFIGATIVLIKQNISKRDPKITIKEGVGILL
tara:strand:- start:2209 stop:2331 length:123 start_codon:yes stop_codon:yes gene_type:complete